MSKIKKIEPLVKSILEEDKEARKDDFLLIASVYNRLSNIKGLSFNLVMLGHKELGLPSLETITRARRKLQAEYEYLRADEETEILRTNEETEFRRYAKE